MPTLAELLVLPAGRKLDAAIVEAMGKHIDWRGRGIEEPYIAITMREMGAEWLRRVLVPRYSADIAAAWLLLAEMLAAGVSVNMAMWNGEFEILLYYTNDQEDPTVFRVPTLTDAPLAIVRAWLTWKLAKEQAT